LSLLLVAFLGSCTLTPQQEAVQIKPTFPLPGEQAVSLTPAFSWDALLGAQSSRGAVFVLFLAPAGQQLVEVLRTTATSATLAFPLFPGTQYHWKVCLEVDGVITKCSSVQAFTTSRFYPLTLSSEPAAGGSIRIDSGIPVTTVTLLLEATRTLLVTASEQPGWDFSGWFENDTLLSNQKEFTLPSLASSGSPETWEGHRQVQARFSSGFFRIQASSDPQEGGLVRVFPDGPWQPSLSFQVSPNQQVQLEAQPSESFHFAGWMENASGARDVLVSQENPLSFPATRDRELVAHFEKDSYPLSVCASPSDWGKIRVNGGPWQPDFAELMQTGSQVSLEPLATTQHLFSRWTENGQTLSEQPSLSFTLDATRSIVAEFLLDPRYQPLTLESSPSS
ncbi:MAG TPA: hypothetical protein P5560_14570, partial [Thermotogota bacterium]|nr:hypothetical protein [Thermotogota bacterium]